MILAETLRSDRCRHGFFTREGGESDGVYASLNTGLGSRDQRANVVANRTRAAAALGVAHDQLVTPYQHHSADVISVTQPWTLGAVPKGDGLVTDVSGIAIAVNTADCTPVLFADPEAGVIGVAHSGWKGALLGVNEAMIAAMEDLGAERSRISVAIGPTISQSAYEVGPEFYQRFVEKQSSFRRFFKSSGNEGHFMFDLPGFIASRLRSLGLAKIEDVNVCTYGDEARFFSYRRTCHRGEPDYGRQLTAIVLT